MVIIGGENITAPFLQPVTLRCAGTGVPTPSLRWWKDGVALAASGGNLQVHCRGPRASGATLHRRRSHFPGALETPAGPWEPGGRASNEPIQLGILSGLKRGGTFNLVHIPRASASEGESGQRGRVLEIRGIPCSLSVWFRTVPRAKLVPCLPSPAPGVSEAWPLVMSQHSSE